LPVAIDTDVESYLAGRWAGLDREIEEVARLADQGKLDGVDLTRRRAGHLARAGEHATRG
jgi:hypothetical protein